MESITEIRNNLLIHFISKELQIFAKVKKKYVFLINIHVNKNVVTIKQNLKFAWLTYTG